MLFCCDRAYKWTRENKYFQICNDEYIAVGGGGSYALYLVRAAAHITTEGLLVLGVPGVGAGVVALSITSPTPPPWDFVVPRAGC